MMCPLIESLLIKHYREPRLWAMLADCDDAAKSCDYLVKAAKYGDQAGYVHGYASLQRLISIL